MRGYSRYFWFLHFLGDIILINSAAAILITGNCHDLNEGINMASVAIDSKAALKKIDELKEVTNKLSE